VLLHAKTAVIDGVWSCVGSTNLDWRSFLHNDELNAVILGANSPNTCKPCSNGTWRLPMPSIPSSGNTGRCISGCRNWREAVGILALAVLTVLWKGGQTENVCYFDWETVT